MQIAGPAGTLVVTDGGTGAPPVLFVHGLVGSAAFWRATLAHLRPRHRAVGFDLRGHGASDPPPNGDYTIAAYASDVLAVADALELQRFVLVGHSLGASVAIETAGRAPERVAGLVLVDAAGSYANAPPGALEQFMGALRSDDYQAVVRDAFTQNLIRATRATRDEVMAGLATARRDAVIGAYEALLSYRPSPVLARYPGATLLIVDDQNDSDFSLHAQESMRVRESISNVSHWLMMDRPAAFHTALDAFLAGLPARRTPRGTTR